MSEKSPAPPPPPPLRLPAPPSLSLDDAALLLVLDAFDALEEDEDDDVEDREDADDEDDELNLLVVPRLELELPGTTAGLELLPLVEESPLDEDAELLVAVDTLDALELPVG